MNILMFTNSCAPRIGGVPQSIQSLRRELALRGHSVLTVAPSDPAASFQDAGILRVPVFARTRPAELPLPILTHGARQRIAAFQPDVVHSHHPFLLGRTALHAAARMGVPLVYTFHTRYDLYACASGRGGVLLEGLFRRMMLGYCRVADAVITPSDSIRDLLLASKVSGPVVTIPSAVDAGRVLGGDGRRLRARLGIDPGAFVLGHVGRLAPEKNLDYLALAVSDFLRQSPDAAFLLGGDGSRRPAMLAILKACGVADRVFWVGPLQSRAIADVYAAMDVFTFTSISETQGLAVAEALAAGIPVIALDSPGVREMLRTGAGVMLERDAPVLAFSEAILRLKRQSKVERDGLCRKARDAVADLTTARVVGATAELYEGLIDRALSQPRRGRLQASVLAELGLLCGLFSGVHVEDLWGRSA